jgi:hypothetical protein
LLKHIVTIIAIISIAIGCSGVGRKRSPDGPVPFRTIISGQYSQADTAAVYLIDNNEQWQKIWDLAMGNQDPLPRAVELDFKNNVALAVFMGKKSSAGHRVEISKITKKGEKLTVLVKNHHSSGGMVLPVVTSPYQLITIPRGKYKLDIRYEQVNDQN